MKSKCKVFTAYLGEIKAKRISLAARSIQIREGMAVIDLTASANEVSRQVTEGAKRLRASNREPIRNRVGRPSLARQAAREARKDPRQPKITDVRRTGPNTQALQHTDTVGSSSQATARTRHATEPESEMEDMELVDDEQLQKEIAETQREPHDG